MDNVCGVFASFSGRCAIEMVAGNAGYCDENMDETSTIFKFDIHGMCFVSFQKRKINGGSDIKDKALNLQDKLD